MLKYLIQKEFLQIRRNSFMPRLIVIFPVVIMCVMPWVMTQEVKDIRVDIVDNDHSVRLRQLVHRIEASTYFIFNAQKPNYEAALKDVERSKADMVLVVPQGYGKGRRGVLIAANAVNGTKGGIGATLMQNEIANDNANVNANVNANHPSSLISPLSLYNPHQDYKVFMIPALLAIVMMLMCGFLPALNIVSEKEKGTIEQINVTPVPKWAFILAKLIPYWIIAMFVVTVCLLLSWLVYGITCQGSLLLVYLLAMLLALFFSSFGLIVSNYSDTLQQAIFVMWFFVVCLLLLSGLFTPTRSMPDWAYLTTYVNPMHHFVDAVRTVFIRGGNCQAIARQLTALTAIALIMSVWAVASYKKNN